MKSTNQPAGAMPVAVGAMPTQSYPTGPVWAAYRLPFPGAIGARELGVCFEGEAGAAIAPATPPATPAPPAVPPTPPVTPATGDPELGEAGKKAIAAERKVAKDAQDALKAAQTELETLKTASLSDSEKAIKTARTEAEAAATAKYEAMLVRSDLRGKLKGAGVTNDTLVELALKASVFAGAKLDPEGRVIDGDKLIEQLKKETPELFAPTGPGTVTRGVQTAPAGQPQNLREAVTEHYTKH